MKNSLKQRGDGEGGREGGRKGGGREGVANWSSHQSEAGNANASGTSVVRLNTEEESRSSFKLSGARPVLRKMFDSYQRTVNSCTEQKIMAKLWINF